MIIALITIHCTFAGEKTFKTGEFVCATQGAFHCHFMLCQNNAVLDTKFILLFGTISFWWNMKQAWKVLWVAITYLLVIKNTSSAITWCAQVQAMILTLYMSKKRQDIS